MLGRSRSAENRTLELSPNRERARNQTRSSSPGIRTPCQDVPSLMRLGLHGVLPTDYKREASAGLSSNVGSSAILVDAATCSSFPSSLSPPRTESDIAETLTGVEALLQSASGTGDLLGLNPFKTRMCPDLSNAIALRASSPGQLGARCDRQIERQAQELAFVGDGAQHGRVWHVDRVSE